MLSEKNTMVAEANERLVTNSDEEDQEVVDQNYKDLACKAAKYFAIALAICFFFSLSLIADAY